MNEIFYIKVITLSCLGVSVVGLMCWIFRPKSKKLYESLSKIPLDGEEKK